MIDLCDQVLNDSWQEVDDWNSEGDAEPIGGRVIKESRRRADYTIKDGMLEDF